MIVKSNSIINGIINDKHGKRGEKDIDGVASCSIHLKIENPPINTVSYALFCEDRDAIPVCGFSWIHWTAANITKTELLENESRTATDFLQGKNSYALATKAGIDVKSANSYGGMAPPNEPHSYDFYIYALDCMLDLKEGFWANDLLKSMDGHILAEYKLSGVYNN